MICNTTQTYNEYHVYFHITKLQIIVPLFTKKMFGVIHDAIIGGQSVHGAIAIIQEWCNPSLYQFYPFIPVFTNFLGKNWEKGRRGFPQPTLVLIDVGEQGTPSSSVLYHLDQIHKPSIFLDILHQARLVFHLWPAPRSLPLYPSESIQFLLNM